MYTSNQVCNKIFQACTPNDATFSKRATTSNSLRAYRSNNLINGSNLPMVDSTSSPATKRGQMQADIPNTLSHCLSSSTFKQDSLSPIKPGHALRTLGDKLFSMNAKDKAVLVKEDKKIYKKSMERYYFRSQAHPNKQALENIASKSKMLDTISPSSKMIIKKQVDSSNWSAQKPPDMSMLSSSILACSNFPKNTFYQSFLNESDCSRFDLASSVLDPNARKSPSAKHLLFD